MSQVQPYFPLLLKGLRATVVVTGLAIALAIVIAFVAGLARMSSRRPVRWLSGVFVEVFRGTSVFVQLYWFFYALPLLIGLQLTPYQTAVIALGLNEGAYAAEIVRGAIKAVPRGQREAAIALNLSPLQRLRRVILPQAVPQMVPSFGNVAVDTLKASSLVGFVTVSELTFTAGEVRTSTGATTAVYGLIMVVYFALALVLALITRWLERRVSLDIARRPPLLPRLALKGVRA